MLFIRLRGMTVSVDLTAPFFLALLSLRLPTGRFLQMLSACLLHETAHLLAIAWMHRKPERLHLSAAGMQLTLKESMLCPVHKLCVILAAGAAANFLAAAGFEALHLPDAAAANLSLGMFNLLPFSGTDGGTLLLALMEQHDCMRHPERPARVMRLLGILTAAGVIAWMCVTGRVNLSLLVMVLYLAGTGAEPAGRSACGSLTV